MRWGLSRWIVPALAVAFVASCTKEKPDTFVYAIVDGVNGKPQAVWAELPPSYQKDAKDLVAAFAAKMDPKVWDDGFAMVKKVVKVAQDKRAFILEQPQVKAMEITPEGYDSAVKIVATIANSEISTHAGLKTVDIEKFLGGTLASLIGDIIKAGDVAAKAAKGPNMSAELAKLKKVKTTVESVEGDKAKVKIEMEGEQPRTEEFVKVEGKWIPKALADGWAPAVTAAKAAIAEFKIEPQSIEAMNQMKPTVDAALEKLLAAKTAEEFNTELAAAMASFGGPGAGAAAAPAPAPAADGTEAADKPADKPAKKGKAAKGKKKK